MKKFPKEPEKPDEKKQRSELMRALSFFSQIGITMAACVVIGVLLGNFLDGLLGSSPWLLLLFSFIGVAAAFKALFDIGSKK